MKQPTNTQRSVCQHALLAIVNPYELLRKYACRECQAVLTCSCDQELALYVLPHQATRGVDAQTRLPLQVTVPLAHGVCHECRGETPPAFPTRPQRGAASLVHRYYWREIYKQANHRFIEWARQQGLPLTGPDGQSTVTALAHQHRNEFEAIERVVVDEIRDQHEKEPKYDFARASDADVLATCQVVTENFPACYITPTIGHVQVLPLNSKDLPSAVSVEEFVAQHMRRAGRQVMFCESRPFHALYATLMWLWVQDPGDSRNRPAGFGGRDGTDAGEDGLIWTILPDDFGSPVHASRRADELKEHVESLPCTTKEMLWLFDYWTPYAQDLRQYLWAYQATDVKRSRRLIEILGPEQVKRILRFLAEDYWGRYLGWPDLVSWRESASEITNVEFTEVKSSSDKLSDDQRDWIVNNSKLLQLPLKIAKVHRTQRLLRP
ncbi:VRR-NUC domain-containing protein [Embleya sp. NPDC020886]|uniref:VRR-NUC domain-containing protein n=1 Tax=Embleya sp. NPDC020886 TaxID=3363980 RepID=UPI003797B3B6